jgi:hypothetical protein
VITARSFYPMVVLVGSLRLISPRTYFLTHRISALLTTYKADSADISFTVCSLKNREPFSVRHAERKFGLVGFHWVENPEGETK